MKQIFLDRLLEDKKNFVALIVSIITVAAVVSVIFILANLSKQKPQILEETEPTQKLAAFVEILTEETTPEPTIEPVTEEPATTAETEPETTKTAEELAWEVINGGYNGPDREAYLGERYSEVQKWIEDNYEPPTPAYVEAQYDEDISYGYPSGDGVLTPDAGINYYGGVLETYYNLDMSWNIDVMRGMGFDAENYPYWVRGDGCKMLGDYIMVAADFGWEPRGTFTYTSLGPAIVVDTGAGGWYWHDICVVW